MIEDKLKDRLLKLYELSKRGVDGERINAEMFLKRLLKKHGISLSQIENNETRNRYYKYSTLQVQQIIAQICYKVLNHNNVYTVRGFKEVSVEATEYQHVQILELIDFHLENYKQERKRILEDLNKAYIQKHSLFRDSEPVEKNYTKEELESIIRMSKMMDSLNDKTYIKKLSNE